MLGVDHFFYEIVVLSRKVPLYVRCLIFTRHCLVFNQPFSRLRTEKTYPIFRPPWGAAEIAKSGHYARKGSIGSWLPFGRIFAPFLRHVWNFSFICFWGFRLVSRHFFPRGDGWLFVLEAVHLRTLINRNWTVSRENLAQDLCPARQSFCGYDDTVQKIVLCCLHRLYCGVPGPSCVCILHSVLFA